MQRRAESNVNLTNKKHASFFKKLFEHRKTDAFFPPMAFYPGPISVKFVSGLRQLFWVKLKDSDKQYN